MNKFYSFIRGLFYLPVKLFFPTKIIAKENMPDYSRLITVSNHLSWIDIPLLAINIKGYRRFIAKKEIGKNKLIHKLALWLGIIFIDRSKADLTAIRQSVKALQANEGLSIFPEGTRNKTDENLHEIKAGVTMLALKGNAPIVPVLIHHKAKVFRKNYLYVGKPFDLSQFQGLRLDAETLEKASEIVAEHMQAAKEALDDYVANKRWIEVRAARKQRNKELKRLNAQARRDYRRTKSSR